MFMCSLSFCVQTAFFKLAEYEEVQATVTLLGGPTLESLSELQLWCSFATNVFTVCIIFIFGVLIAPTSLRYA